MQKLFAIVIFPSIVFAVSACSQQAKLILPSEAIAIVRSTLTAQNSSSAEEMKRIQENSALKILDSVESKGLQPEESLAYADLLTMANKLSEARDHLLSTISNENVPVHKAWRKLFTLYLKDNLFDELEQKSMEYRARYDPAPTDTEYLYTVTRNLALHYEREGNYGKAVDVIIADITALPHDAPYRSFRLPGRMYKVFEKAGRLQEAVPFITETQTWIQARVVTLRAEQIPSNKQTIKSYELILGTLNAGLTQIDLIGKMAPEFTFTHFINTDPVSLNDLRGKVVLVDFWATWCAPCITALPLLMELYEKHKTDGFEILAINSLQERFDDGSIQPIDEEKELSLRREFVEKHEISWPVVISEENVFNPDYGVMGIPTYALVDKNGIVRHFVEGTAPGSYEEIAEWVEKLLAEK